MSRKKKPLPLLQNVTIEAVAAEGKCLFHWEELVVFVPFCVPGDVVDVQIRRKKHSFAEGEVVHMVQPSKVRAVPFCQHFGVCGGCKWQNLPYEEQLRFKQQQVYDQLHRIAKVDLPPFNPILGSVKTIEYRNKLDFGCANKRYLTKEQFRACEADTSATPDGASLKDHPAIGFHVTGAFDKILPVERCWLMDDLHNRIRNEIRDYAIAHGLSFFDLRQQVGLLRDVIIRNSASGEWMVIVQFHYDHTGGEREALGLLQHVADTFPQISSLLYLDNQKCNDTIGDQEILIFKGQDYIYELMEDLRFKVGPKSFYQTNTEQAYHLYSVVRRMASLTGIEQVYDLYTGTGTIANFVARQTRQVIGIEYVPEAIEDAKVNASINNIGNTRFYAGDMKDILTADFIERHGHPDLIITDPPRAGMHPDVVQTILRAAPQRIVYVSCNPATQARDLQLLDADYRVVEVQPVDMFPHTPHVENVVLLARREEKRQMKAALFDLDGVVFDTEPQYTEFWGTQCRLYHPEHPGLEHEIKGQTLTQIYDRWFSGPLQAEQQVVTRRLDDFEATMDFIFVPGFEQFVASLRAHGVKTAVVTSSNMQKMKSVYRAHPDFQSLFDAILTSEDFTESKPSPACYLTAAQRFGVSPDECIVFEDSFNGLRSGRAAGMHVVGLATTNSSESIKPLSDFQTEDYTSFNYDSLNTLFYN